MKTRNVRIALVLSAVLGIAACDQHHGSPTAPVPLAHTLTSLTISGNTSISRLGGTTQLTATASYSDFTTREVTAEAQWSSSNSDSLGAVVSVISPGLIRGERYGQGGVRATYASAQGSASANAQVRVVPDLVFLVTVAVSDHGFATEAARVQVTSPAGTFSVTTDLWGVVSLPAVGDATVQVEKAGFRTITRSLTVTSDQTIEVVLQPSDPGA
jgi:hypothetical protein